MGETEALAPLTPAEIRRLRSRAQLLGAGVHLGKGGVSPAFLAGLDRELSAHGLVKVRLGELKDRRHEVGDRLAHETRSHLVTVIGHVVVLYRPKPAAPPAAA